MDEQRPADKLFEGCCKRGDAVLDRLRTPQIDLWMLLENHDPLSRDFRQNIRGYNSALAFTSINYTKDTHIDLNSGIHCFQIHGESYHYQGPFIPGSQEIPSFAQLFFYDPDYATDIRASRYLQLNKTVLS